MFPKDSKGLSKDVVGRISACLRKIECRCVLDESQKAWESAGVQVNIACSNIVAGQETWQRKDKVVNVDGYKWFGKPRIDQNSRRGEGGVGFLVRECIAEEVEFIRDVRYKESVWMKVRGGRGKEALYLCCVYMPTEGSAAAVIEDGYERLKEDVLEYQQKGRVVLLGDFNARVGKSTDVDDVIGIFGEDTCNRSGNNFLE